MNSPEAGTYTRFVFEAFDVPDLVAYSDPFISSLLSTHWGVAPTLVSPHTSGRPRVQRLLHGGVTEGSQKTWTLCNSDDVVAFKTIMPEDSPFILMVDRGDCTFVSKARLIVPFCMYLIQP